MQTKILSHFKNADPKLYKHMNAQGVELIGLTPSDKYFYRLCRSIAYQQLAGKAAETIFGRFEALLKNKEFIPESILKLKHEDMRGAGLSNAKAMYIKNIAEFFDKNLPDPSILLNMENDEAIRFLTQIKGVGQWTVEMFLMFTLGREDVFSFGDFGLAKGFGIVHGFEIKSDKKRAEEIISSWSPYKTYASFALWNAVDNK